jgi:hypothetical protein
MLDRPLKTSRQYCDSKALKTYRPRVDLQAGVGCRIAPKLASIKRDGVLSEVAADNSIDSTLKSGEVSWCRIQHGQIAETAFDNYQLEGARERWSGKMIDMPRASHHVSY